jgi:hypothetical protein
MRIAIVSVAGNFPAQERQRMEHPVPLLLLKYGMEVQEKPGRGQLTISSFLKYLLEVQEKGISHFQEA